MPDKNNNHVDTEDRGIEASMWYKVHQVGSVLLGRKSAARAKKYRRFSGELPPEE